ncbi:actin cortical patch component Aip1 [Schizosaccharomyces japonicus yFS275]|uniref:Actin cortical patch component Aip1 n=1 Tax=Schizosaccharomyces japonicus (strain yFS275 / FY16936) TaxID=402676 RepID=B6K431_SCHJY|nr:actin cortical patch component Aip1 [Schizosaccharomyces japonicus yFS275]EEB08238.1 actin cortical patch component Aip1 [Schizosaccharomyces japonicus yFS275]
MSYSHVTTWAPAPRTVRGGTSRITYHPKENKIAYANNRSIILRDVAHPDQCFQYVGHTAATTVARFSPSGFYVASGDAHGNVRIWDCVGEEHILKSSFEVLSGPIHDVDWDGESQRLIAVGEGKERFGHAFSADTGNTIGEIFGHSSVINAVTMKQNRPLRAVTASDDQSVNFFFGVPYKFNRSLRTHTKFVFDVRYSPNDDYFASVGADGKLFLYDGKTGDVSKEINAHKGSIFAVSWSPDSTQIVTASADHTVKLWDFASGELVREWIFSETASLDKQQVGIVWANDTIISVSMDGTLTYLKPDSNDPIRSIIGHQRSITASAFSADKSQLFTASYDGKILSWDIEKQLAQELDGSSHTNQVMQMINVGNNVVSIGMDDTLRAIDANTRTFIGDVYATGFQPVGLCEVNKAIVLVTVADIQILRNFKRLATAKTVYQPSAIAAHPTKHEFSIGGSDSVVYVHSLENDEICETTKCKESQHPITCLSYSPDGKYLACGDSSGKVVLYDANTYELITSRWAFHTGRIASMAWHPDCKHLATASLDTNVHIYSVERPMKYIGLKNIHALGASQVQWLSKTELFTMGSDATVQKWDITF